MDTSRQTRLMGPIATALVLACGVVAVWGYVAVWVQQRLNEWVFHSMSESLEITRDGRALIRHMQLLGGSWVISYRTPDGQDVTEPLDLTAPSVQLEPPMPRPVRLGWSWRIQGFSDTRTVAAEWYLIREQASPGRAYFAIYDSQTKELLGFFGPQGFRPDRPPAEEQFTGMPQNGLAELPSAFEDYGWAQWQRTSSLYLVAQGKLWCINLEKRSIRSIELADEPASVALATESTQSGDHDRIEYQVVVRTMSEIVFLDEHGTPKRALPIPAEIRSRGFNVCRTVADEVVLTSTRTYGDFDVYWLGGRDGGQRHENIRLAGFKSPD